jgi:O-antigen/teichoic acid export membrane protein
MVTNLPNLIFVALSTLNQVLKVGRSIVLVFTAAFLSLEVAGEWAILSALIAVSRPFVTMGIEPVLSVRIAQNKNVPDRFWWAYFLFYSIVVSGLLTAIGGLGSEFLRRFGFLSEATVFHQVSEILLFASVFTTGLSSVITMILTSMRAIRYQLIVNLLLILVSSLSCSLFIKYIDNSVNSVLIAYTLSNIVAVVLGGIYLSIKFYRRDHYFSEAYKINHSSRLYGIIVGVIAPSNIFITRFFVLSAFGAEVVAVFSILNQLYISMPALAMPGLRVVRSSQDVVNFRTKVVFIVCCILLLQGFLVSGIFNYLSAYLSQEKWAYVTTCSASVFGVYSSVRLFTGVLEVDAVKRGQESLLTTLSGISVAFLFLSFLVVPLTQFLDVALILLFNAAVIFLCMVIISRRCSG